MHPQVNFLADVAVRMIFPAEAALLVHVAVLDKRSKTLRGDYLNFPTTR